MKLGICLPHYGRPIEPSRLAQLAARAEEVGLDSVWVTDHVVVPQGAALIYRDDMLDPLAVLPWLAGVTERITLGTSVIVLPYRSPLPVAKLLASVDVLSGGRLVVGVAVGWLEAEFAALGVPFHERGRRTDEAIELFRAVWTRDHPDVRTAHHDLSGVKVSPMPLQKPRPPILVGGASDAALRRAARLGDGWIPIWASPDRYARGLIELREQADGRDVTPGVVLPSLVGGTVDDARAYLSARYATEFSSHAIERYCLTGPPSACAERVAEYVEAGVRHVVFHPAVEAAGLQAQIELAAEVARGAEVIGAAAR
jgi:probable F420-dependent oxidoreductase